MNLQLDRSTKHRAQRVINILQQKSKGHKVIIMCHGIGRLYLENGSRWSCTVCISFVSWFVFLTVARHQQFCHWQGTNSSQPHATGICKWHLKLLRWIDRKICELCSCYIVCGTLCEVIKVVRSWLHAHCEVATHADNMLVFMCMLRMLVRSLSQEYRMRWQ